MGYTAKDRQIEKNILTIARKNNEEKQNGS